MKKIVCLVVLLQVAATTQAQQVQNPGFENWTSAFPQNWGSYSQSIVNNGHANPNLEAKTTTVHTGSFAIVLQNQALLIAGGNNAPGGICTCPITFNGGPILGWGPYSSTPVSYDFWYQFNAVGGDDAITTLYITKWNTGTNQRDTLARGSSLITGTTSVYTQMTVSITWLITGQTPDSMQLSFVSSTKVVGSGVPTGGMLYIDDVTMNTAATGIQSHTDAADLLVYPNPTKGVFKITSTTTDKLSIDLYDLNGKHVLSKTIVGTSDVDASFLENGVYTLTIKGKQTTANKKLIIVR